MVNNVTIGTDIELFVKDTETDEFVSAEGYARGTKKEPFVFDPENRFFATSLDNVAFEFGIPPVRSAEDFVNNIHKAISFVNSQLPNRLCSVAFGSAQIADRFLQTPNAMLFGCEPDYNVWFRESNHPPVPEGNLRSAGFHVHIGYDSPNMQDTEDLVKACDLFLGVPSLLIDPDEERRKLYGKGGAFRPKEYGLEYRVLSSFFASNDRLITWVYENTQRAIDYVNKRGEFDENFRFAIDLNDKSLAAQIIEKYNVPLP